MTHGQTGNEQGFYRIFRRAGAQKYFSSLNLWPNYGDQLKFVK